MAVLTGLTVDEYLARSFRPDCDYVDGEVLERNMGEFEHSRLQNEILLWFGFRRKQMGLQALPELRLRVGTRRFRIPDVMVLRPGQAETPVIAEPPLICIEVLSKDDSLRSLRARIDDYLGLGVPYIWVFDPALRRAWVATERGEMEPEDRVLRTIDPEIALPIDDLFA